MRSYTKRVRSTKSIAGSLAKANGADAEQQLLDIAEIYAKDFRAEICKRYEPYKRVGGGGGTIFRATYTHKSGCDFELWLPDGRAGHIEMKSREADRISKDVIDEAQSAQLHRRLAWGQLALVLVRLRGDWFLVNYANWNNENRKSHTISQLQEIGGIRVPLHAGLPDFLKVLDLALQPPAPLDRKRPFI